MGNVHFPKVDRSFSIQRQLEVLRFRDWNRNRNRIFIIFQELMIPIPIPIPAKIDFLTVLESILLLELIQILIPILIPEKTES